MSVAFGSSKPVLSTAVQTAVADAVPNIDRRGTQHAEHPTGVVSAPARAQDRALRLVGNLPIQPRPPYAPSPAVLSWLGRQTPVAKINANPATETPAVNVAEVLGRLTTHLNDLPQRNNRNKGAVIRVRKTIDKVLQELLGKNLLSDPADVERIFGPVLSAASPSLMAAALTNAVVSLQELEKFQKSDDYWQAKRQSLQIELATWIASEARHPKKKIQVDAIAQRIINGPFGREFEGLSTAEVITTVIVLELGKLAQKFPCGERGAFDALNIAMRRRTSVKQFIDFLVFCFCRITNDQFWWAEVNPLMQEYFQNTPKSQMERLNMRLRGVDSPPQVRPTPQVSPTVHETANPIDTQALDQLLLTLINIDPPTTKPEFNRDDYALLRSVLVGNSRLALKHIVSQNLPVWQENAILAALTTLETDQLTYAVDFYLRWAKAQPRDPNRVDVDVGGEKAEVATAAPQGSAYFVNDLVEQLHRRGTTRLFENYSAEVRKIKEDGGSKHFGSILYHYSAVELKVMESMLIYFMSMSQPVRDTLLKLENKLGKTAWIGVFTNPSFLAMGIFAIDDDEYRVEDQVYRRMIWAFAAGCTGFLDANRMDDLRYAFNTNAHNLDVSLTRPHHSITSGALDSLRGLIIEFWWAGFMASTIEGFVWQPSQKGHAGLKGRNIKPDGINTNTHTLYEMVSARSDIKRGSKVYRSKLRQLKAYRDAVLDGNTSFKAIELHVVGEINVAVLADFKNAVKPVNLVVRRFDGKNLREI